MTPDEVAARIAIADRLGRIALAGDARKAEAYAACFAIDGVLELGEPIGRLEGRAAILSWMNAPSVFAQASGGSPGFVCHHVTSSRIDLTGATSAIGRTYFLVTTAAGIDHNGYYDDAFELKGGEWLIAHRRPRTLWISPASVLHASSKSPVQ